MLQPDSVNFVLRDSSEFVFGDAEIDTVIKTARSVEKHNLFSGKEYRVETIKPVPREKPVADWFTLTAILVVVYYTTLFLLNGKAMARLIKAFFNISVSNQLVRDENLVIQRTSVLLSVGFYAVAGLLLYLAGKNYYSGFENIQDFFWFFLIAAVLAILYFLKIILVRFLGYVFNAPRIADNYIFNILLINNIAGMTLLPFLFFQVYAISINSGIFLKITFVIALSCWLYRLVRGSLAWFSYSTYSLHYLFFYICILEIAPLLIVIKIL